MSDAARSLSIGDGFHIAEELHRAPNAEARARILLRVPDLVLMQMAPALDRACGEIMFELGQRYILVRTASFAAVRDELGELPDDEWERVEQVAQLLREFAGVRP